MKHLRVALEAETPETDASAEQTVDVMEQITEQLDTGERGSVGLESGSWRTKETSYQIVTARNLLPVAMEASGGIFAVLFYIVLGTIALLSAFSRWFGKRSGGSRSGGGGGSSGSRVRYPSDDHLKEQTEKMRKNNEKIVESLREAAQRAREEFIRNTNKVRDDFTAKKSEPIKKPTVDLNEKPQAEEVINRFAKRNVKDVGDIIDVVFEDVKEEDKPSGYKRFVEYQDKVFYDVAMAEDHYVHFRNMTSLLRSVNMILRTLEKTLKGAVSHHLETDLLNGHIRDVYLNPIPNVDSTEYKNVTVQDIVKEIKFHWSALDSVQRKSGVLMYGKARALFEDNCSDIRFADIHAQQIEHAEIIADMNKLYEEFNHSLEKHKSDEASEEAKKAITVMSTWLRDVSSFMAGSIQLSAHITQYFENIQRTTEAFHAFEHKVIGDLWQLIPPGARSEQNEDYKKYQKEYKDLQKVSNT